MRVAVRQLIGGLIGLITATAVASSCTSSAPDSPPTVLVTNASCDAGRCTTFEIRAFMWKFTVPQNPDGLEILGEVPPGQTCLSFPDHWTFRVIGPDTTGHVDTLVITWTPDDGSEIYLVAVDSALYHLGPDSAQADSLGRGLLPYFDNLVPGSVGETPNFSPGASPGWEVSFPSTPVHGAKLVESSGCES